LRFCVHDNEHITRQSTRKRGRGAKKRRSEEDEVTTASEEPLGCRYQINILCPDQQPEQNVI